MRERIKTENIERRTKIDPNLMNAKDQDPEIKRKKEENPNLIVLQSREEISLMSGIRNLKNDYIETN